jgi:Leucine-rich repeat (LRR) protein
MRQLLTVFILLALPSLAKSQEVDYASLDTCKVYTSIESALEADGPVYRLDLTRSRLRKLPPELFQLTSLQELILDRNKLKTIPPEIVELKNLQHLSVSRNKLTTFPPVLCNLRSLVRLDLSSNEVDKIPDEIHRLQNLEELILWSNLIGYYPTTLMRLKSIKVVDLLHNEMSEPEQERIRQLLEGVDLKLSPPCDCTFADPDEDEEE